ncbi:MAG: hypothetical protein INF81_17690 [Roseomonas sp.]|nr:hypothetical protein [Roseomonas sp.]MCA3430326.1 hypothetical protein [Roseomonas sp.]MCA3433948.1 hypothetical protein [Roseomonas sp.]
MTEETPQFNIGNGMVAGVSVIIGMTVTQMFFHEQTILIKGLISVVIGLATVLFLNVAIKTFRKLKDQG